MYSSSASPRQFCFVVLFPLLSDWNVSVNVSLGFQRMTRQCDDVSPWHLCWYYNPLERFHCWQVVKSLCKSWVGTAEVAYSVSIVSNNKPYSLLIINVKYTGNDSMKSFTAPPTGLTDQIQTMIPQSNALIWPPSCHERPWCHNVLHCNADN